jgi:HAD superfamily hydrolase (TIGR01549 family)
MNNTNQDGQRRPRVVLLDVDGTLIDSVDQHATAWTEALKEAGHPVEFARVRNEIGKGSDQLMKEFLSEEEIERGGEELSAQTSEIFKRRFRDDLKAFPATRPFVQRLKEDGYRVVLASSAKSDELKNYQRLAEIEDLLDEATSSEDVERSKPHPDIFREALSRAGDFSPSEAIVIGDSPWDAKAATLPSSSSGRRGASPFTATSKTY